MERRAIKGVNALGEDVKLAKDVCYFTDTKNYFRIVLNVSSITITTPKGVYKLEKHPVLNIYQGICNGHKTHISLKAVVGDVRFW